MSGKATESGAGPSGARCRGEPVPGADFGFSDDIAQLLQRLALVLGPKTQKAAPTTADLRKVLNLLCVIEAAVGVLAAYRAG